MNEPTLEYGAQGDWVTYLQQLLARAGYDPGPVDGDFGAGTVTALRSFQGDYGLTVDGSAGPLTWAVLTGENAPVPDPVTDPWPDPEPAVVESEAVPQELVTAGAPAALGEWNQQQQEAFFDGRITQSGDAGIPEDVPLLAINDTSSDEDGQTA